MTGLSTFSNTAEKMKFPIKDFLSKCDQIRSFLLKKSLMENFIFFAVKEPSQKPIRCSKSTLNC